MLTIARLHALVHYDPASGLWTWLVSRGRARAGMRAGCLHPEGYRYIQIDGNKYAEHRLAWFYMHGEWPPELLDHRDFARDHNAMGNLRLATIPQNRRHRRDFKVNKTGYRGVFLNKRDGRFNARIEVDGVLRHLGTRGTAEAASALYENAARAQYGDFAP